MWDDVPKARQGPGPFTCCRAVEWKGLMALGLGFQGVLLSERMGGSRRGRERLAPSL